MVNVV